MKHNFFSSLAEMRSFLILWLGQSFSSLGSAMTGYALVIWSYTSQGSALATALLMVSTYAPYVLLSIFAGALSDRWNKKATMLICDTIAAITTVVVLILLSTDSLQLWHIYAVNIIGGIMNTVQQPASEVAVTRLLPENTTREWADFATCPIPSTRYSPPSSPPHSWDYSDCTPCCSSTFSHLRQPR